MSLFRRSGKKTEKIHVESAKIANDLEAICGNDGEALKALRPTMFLDPRKVETTMKKAAENAARFEKENNLARAKMWYDIAGGLAIYEGNAKKTVEFFSESAKISGKEYPILKNADKAVAKAQEYYKKYLKD